MYTKIYDGLINIYNEGNIQIVGDVQHYQSSISSLEEDVLMSVKIYNTDTKELLYVMGNNIHLGINRLSNMVENIVLIVNNCNEDVFSSYRDKMVKSYVKILDKLFIDKSNIELEITVKRIKRNIETGKNDKRVEIARNEIKENEQKIIEIATKKGLTYYSNSVESYLINRENVNTNTCKHIINMYENGNDEAKQLIKKVIYTDEVRKIENKYHEESHRDATANMLDYIKNAI